MPEGRDSAWEPVVPRIGFTVEDKCTELKAYRYQGKVIYEVRPLYTPKD